MNIQGFRTLNAQAEEEYIVQKSRFIACALPVETEEDAVAAIGRIQKEHPQARHHCYAYIVGANSGTMRYSDDGEPAGTAGLPILGVLQTKRLVNACVVVTRYFGGILLGTGGLARAYGHSCALAVQRAGVIEKEPTRRLLFSVSYALWDRVHYLLKSRADVQIERIAYGADVSAALLVRDEVAGDIQLKLTDAVNQPIDGTLSEPFIHCWQAAAQNE